MSSSWVQWIKNLVFGTQTRQHLITHIGECPIDSNVKDAMIASVINNQPIALVEQICDPNNHLSENAQHNLIEFVFSEGYTAPRQLSCPDLQPSLPLPLQLPLPPSIQQGTTNSSSSSSSSSPIPVRNVSPIQSPPAKSSSPANSPSDEETLKPIKTIINPPTIPYPPPSYYPKKGRSHKNMILKNEKKWNQHY